MSVELHLGDCLEVLRGMAENSIDSIVTDPPYGLRFMGKRWDHDVPAIEVWAECLRVLKPGGHLLAFAGTRTQHRMAVRIEDAGFEIRDMIAWIYGSGFPKSLNVSMAIDRSVGAEREVVRVVKAGRSGSADETQSGGRNYRHGEDRSITAPATDAAHQWQGWGTALKPALEPITVARKPLVGTVAANVLAHGTGAINIDGCRLGSTRGVPVSLSKSKSSNTYGYGSTSGHIRELNPNIGRWPANLIHDGSDEVLAAFPQAGGAMAPVKGSEASSKNANAFGDFAGRAPSDRRDGGGSAARFFYCAKASKSDREVGNMHPTVKPTPLMAHLVRMVTPPGGVVLDPYMGSGSTGKAATRQGFAFVGIEQDAEYFAVARARIRC